MTNPPTPLPADPSDAADPSRSADPSHPAGRAHPPHDRRTFLVASVAAGGAVAAAAAIPWLRRVAADAGPGDTTAAARSSPAAAAPGATVLPAGPPATEPSGVSSSPDTSEVGLVEGDDVAISVVGGRRTIVTASMPDHGVDPAFRYPGTPRAQDLRFTMTTTPTPAAAPTPVTTGQVFAVHVNGVVFDPATAEWYGGRQSPGGWNENAGHLDRFGAHTRPGGFYHYHRITDAWSSWAGAHGPLVAWAADGYPVYLRHGYADPADATSAIVDLRASYRLRAGTRPDGPGGAFDGTYVQDYEFVASAGDLDACNGRVCVTPEFPAGTYAYFLTDQWPFVPHWIRGTPDPSFAPGNGGGSGRPSAGGSGPGPGR